MTDYCLCMTPTHTHPSADVDPSATIAAGCTIWHLAQVREGAFLGADSVVGRGAYLGPGVQVGKKVKIQNYALIYEPAEIGDYAFIGPAAVITNDRYPRSTDPSGHMKGVDDWDPAGVIVGTGASIGARVVVLAGVSVGNWALVGAGAVVVRDVPAHGLVVGNPATQVGWVGRSGNKLIAENELWRCPSSGELYGVTGTGLELHLRPSGSHRSSHEPKLRR
jgi:UDP-3-O-[3-hydroxymyristoyl] glucosamine N-acyltransferase